MGLSWPHGHFRGDGGHLVVKAEIQKLNDAGVGSTGQWKDEGACSTCILLVHRFKCDRHPFLCHGACRGAPLPEPLSASKLQSFSQQKHLELDHAVLYLPKLFDEGLGILKLLMVVFHLPGAAAWRALCYLLGYGRNFGCHSLGWCWFHWIGSVWSERRLL